MKSGGIRVWGLLSLSAPLLLAGYGCKTVVNPGGAATFGADVSFLKEHTDVIVLESPGSEAKVAVVPSMQARVMSSSTSGDRGKSHGWINYELIASHERQDHMNGFGGEDRFWIGPEGGQYSIFFKKGDSFDLDHWWTPEPIDWGSWDLVGREHNRARFRKAFTLDNYSGSRFDVVAERTIRVYSREEIGDQLDVSLADDVQAVGYESDNRLQNAGAEAWTKPTGLLSIWILGMFRPSPSTIIVIPFKSGPESERGAIVNDAYFGKVPSDRLHIDERGFVFFRGDGRYRSKIGISPSRAKNVLGSYDADNRVLTLIKFTLPDRSFDYVNSMWEIQETPYGGDVANSYNDGPPAPGVKPLGPFYELESSSPAAALAPGESIQHVHRTFHFVGTVKELDRIAESVLGIGLNDIASAF